MLCIPLPTYKPKLVHLCFGGNKTDAPPKGASLQLYITSCASNGALGFALALTHRQVNMPFLRVLNQMSNWAILASQKQKKVERINDLFTGTIHFYSRNLSKILLSTNQMRVYSFPLSSRLSDWLAAIGFNFVLSTYLIRLDIWFRALVPR